MNSGLAVANACVSFRLNYRSLKGRTETWEVWSLHDAIHLGQVRWYSRWRRYCFFPSSGTVYDPDYLRSIARFLEEETASQRKGKRSFREASA
jgi:hypothetical protein